MRNLRENNKNILAKKHAESGTNWAENNLLQIYRRHSILAVVILVIVSITTIWIVNKNMNSYKNACQFSFIYYKNGSSVLVQNLENSNKRK